MQPLAAPKQMPLNVVVFPTCMSTALQSKSETKHTWRNPAAIFAAVAALAALGSLYVNWSNRADQKSAQSKQEEQQKFSEAVNSLIDAKLNTAVTSFNAHVDQKVDPVGKKVEDLAERVSRLEGPLTRRISSLETRTKQQAALANMLNPARILAFIRDNISLARKTEQHIPTEQLVDYKGAIQELPQSAQGFWETVATIINYQSLINQMDGNAPDPTGVSRLCPGVSTDAQHGVYSSHNLFVGATISNCVVDLDTLAFSGVVFKNSVIRYHGGRVFLNGVTFVNCYFDVQLPANQTPTEEKPARAVLFTLLNSQNQVNVRISTPAS